MSFRQNHHVATSNVLAKADWENVLQLWNEGFPVEIQMDNSEALQKAIEGPECKYYVIRNSTSKIEAWLAVFNRYETRWFSILVSKKSQGKGHGTSLIQYAQTTEQILEGWVVQSDNHLRVDGEVYKSPLDFYWKLGFRQNPNRVAADRKLDVICVKWESA